MIIHTQKARRRKKKAYVSNKVNYMKEIIKLQTKIVYTRAGYTTPFGSHYPHVAMEDLRCG